MEQTAVEWLVSKLPQRMLNYLKEEIEQAKEMEKQQQEKMYSEEEVLKLLLSLPQYNGIHKDQLINQWFKQFKKK